MADAQQPEICGRARLANARVDGDLSPCPDGHLALSTAGVFAGDEVSLDVSFAAARARLASLAQGGLLGGASAQAYSDGFAGLARAGTVGPAPGLSGLVQVYFQDLKAHGNSALLALRWEVTGPGGKPFPVLDADLMLIPAGEHSTTLTLIGAYRAPPGTARAGLDQAVMARVATATIRAFLWRVAQAIAHPARVAEPQAGAADPDPPRPPPEPETP